MTNTTIRYYLHYEIGDFHLQGSGNPLELTSPDGATWQAPTTMPLIELTNYFDGLAQILNYGGSGTGADTIDFYGFSISRPGFPPGFSQDVFFIETRLSDADIGKNLCLDSVWNSVSDWVWATAGGESYPSWDGPHCLEIVDCCAGNRGDVNGDGIGPNILDLTRLVDYLFRGAPNPSCALESDANNDGTPSNILDLTYIVDYMHRGGPPPGQCPNN
jgi:hypothetical protein